MMYTFFLALEEEKKRIVNSREQNSPFTNADKLKLTRQLLLLLFQQHFHDTQQEIRLTLLWLSPFLFFPSFLLLTVRAASNITV